MIAYFKTSHIFVFVAIGVSLTSTAAAQVRSRDITGAWIMSRGRFDNTEWSRMSVARSGDSLSATGSFGQTYTGHSDADRYILTSRMPDGRIRATIEVRFAGDSLVGTSVEGTRTWNISLTRERTRPSSAPHSFRFTPDHFSSAFTSAAEPVLHIWPGDTVRTQTGGPNAKYAFGNALTGPIFVEGAMPGDILVIRLLRVRANRPTSVSGGFLVWWGVQPGYFAAGAGANGPDATWLADTVSGQVRLANPSDGLRNFAIPLRPMLGCVGVAPGRGESKHGGELGYWGGNLDYNRVVEGATVLLQVNQPGALLFLGDGHAAQGQGELTGQGLETSLDVDVVIDVIRERGNGPPKMVDAQSLMASGIAGSIDEAFKNATTAMANLLQREFVLTRNDVALIMGSSIEYDVAEVVDGGIYHIVARMPRLLLAGLTPRPDGITHGLSATAPKAP